MKDFIDSLSNGQRDQLGKLLCDGLCLTKTSGTTRIPYNAEDALQHAVEQFLVANLTAPREDGFGDYVCATSKAVIAGLWDSLEAIQDEVDEMVFTA
jgi:hypothetical protein